MSAVRMFTATTISSSTLWLRGDAGVTTVSNSVSQWNDQSGNGHNFTQATASTRPTLLTSSVLNNRPVINFDGSDDLLNGPLIPSIESQDLSLFVVTTGNSQTGATAGIFCVGAFTSGFWLSRSINSSAQAQVRVNNTSLLLSPVNSLPTTGFNGALIGVNRAVGASSSLFLNGTQVSNSTNSVFNSNFTNSTIVIGRAPTYSSLNGQIAEVILYNRIP
jgi:hypothetical protein